MSPLRYIRDLAHIGKSTISSEYNRAQEPCFSKLAYNEDLFYFTRGRFVCNEKYEMRQHHVRFDVNELARRATEATAAKACTNIEKLPEGMYNKSMLLTMDDGSQIVAKVPNPNAGLPHFTTASEVATMDFARNILNIPVPKVLAWSSRAHKNIVGAEYILMEKAPGVELEHVWPSMKIKDRFALVKEICRFQEAWTSISFTKFGSLYYSEDTKKTTGNEPLYMNAKGEPVFNERFAVGPSMGREWVDSDRATIDLDRGPWNSLKAYHIAIYLREMTCIKQLPNLPKSPITLCGPGTYQPTREKKLKALDCYLELLQFLIPADQSIKSSHLWHNDLHVANIFVDPDEPTKIVSVIDWQSTELSPLYFQARQPEIIDYHGPPVHGLERPQLPNDVEELEPQAKQHAETLWFQQSLCSLYNTLTHKKNPRLYAALEFQQTEKFSLLLLARNLLIDGEATYLAQVAELEKTWSKFSGYDGSHYPWTFSAKEKEEFEMDVEGAAQGMDVMRSMKESLGELFPEQGIVRPERYDEAVDALDQMKEQVIDAFAKGTRDREEWERAWPFRP